MKELRVRVRENGTVKLPREALEALQAEKGSYLKLVLEHGRLTLEKTVYDPFTEGPKGPDPDAFDKVMKRRKEELNDAEKEFRDKLRNPPETRPEDRPDFWD